MRKKFRPKTVAMSALVQTLVESKIKLVRSFDPADRAIAETFIRILEKRIEDAKAQLAESPKKKIYFSHADATHPKD